MCWTAVRRGSSALAPPLTRGLRPSPLVSSPSGQRRGEQLCAGRRRGEPAACWRRLSTRGARPSPPVSVAAWTAARRGSCALAPPVDSEHPSVAARLCRRLDSGAARQQCDGAASRLEASVRRACLISVWTAVRGGCALAPPLDSRRPSIASRLRRRQYSSAASSRALDSGAARQQCAGAASQLETPVRRLLSHRRLYSGAASSCALDDGAASQLRAGAAPRLETPVRRLSSLSPPGQRRGGAAVRWRRLSTRGLRPSPLVSSPSGQLCDEAVVRWRRPSTRGPRPSPLVSSPSGQWCGEQRCAGQRRS